MLFAVLGFSKDTTDEMNLRERQSIIEWPTGYSPGSSSLAVS